MKRFFRTADAALYESVRVDLDSIWGHPTSDGKTITCIDPVSKAPRDTEGNVLLALRSDFCEMEAVAAVLPQLLTSGAVEEISEEHYRQSVSQPSEY